MYSQANNDEAVKLIDEVRAGNNDRYVQLVDMYKKQLAGYVWTNAQGTLGKEDIEDILQDTWAELYLRIKDPSAQGQYDSARGSFYTYIVNMARYKILKRLKNVYMTQDVSTFDKDAEGTPAIERLPDTDEIIPENALLLEAESRVRHDAYMELLRMVFLCGGYPHQQLAFAISKLLLGRRSRRGVEGKIDILYNQLGSIPLSGIFLKFIGAMEKRKEHKREVLAEILPLLEPLKKRLNLSLEALMAEDKPSSDFFKSILSKQAQETCFKDYYEISKHAGAEKSTTQISNTVANWILKLEERIRRLLGMESGGPCSDDVDIHAASGSRKAECRKCKFRMLPTCCNNFQNNREKC